MKVTFSFPAPCPKHWLSVARYVGSCWGERWGSWMYQGTCQPWGAAAAALAWRCWPVVTLLGNGVFFPRNRKFVLLSTMRVYALFLNDEFLELGIVSASNQRYVYTYEKPSKYFLWLIAVYVFTYMIRKLTSVGFFWSPAGSPRAKGPEGGALYTATGHREPIQGTSVTPLNWAGTNSCSGLACTQMVKSYFFLHSEGHIPRGLLRFCAGFARQLLLSLVTEKPIWFRGKNLRSLICKEFQPTGGIAEALEML